MNALEMVLADALGRGAVHHDESAVGIERESTVGGDSRQAVAQSHYSVEYQIGNYMMWVT